MPDLQKLTDDILAVCPIDGVETPSNWSDKSSYVVWYRPEATQAQRDAAAAVIAAFDSTAEPVPRSVMLWRVQAILDIMGITSQIDEYVESQKTENPVLWRAWNRSSEITRYGTFVTELAPVFGLTSDQVDQIFIQAAALEP